ncbi:PIN domain-containing protein [Desertifilum sp. FACHB-1129]|uniref:DNA-binding protein n=2 Tax=Desertifilum tharense IPPAS B-1220 TaxID=1781255 RepID=A0A1E5QQW6_9CYAN|nr:MULTISPECIES: PIN domain-containing protein [Desertifilum]MDA0210755.1 PIN domain-containing protein [Cyanobacteria bacterium FC1]MBD2312241.1 PIN domain-containing protein [Desertifilum sp. FACHB-1129]MBD2323692.1 PIN domain-containing protein [Desertifilum sp. FACHB-866]MBD2332389.1 PIN domain-containing protein [Desertifilum sp. FACHB-868]OEJ77075.1 DNA-binding protein [Desertifilum tharense IPPAS B-1220]
MKVLVDTNIILDFLLERELFLQEAKLLFQAINSSQIKGYVTATTLTDIFYIARRHTQSLERARQSVVFILSSLEVCPIDRTVLELALTSTTPDFEDALQVSCALAQGLDAIVTRDAKFPANSIQVLSIHELMQKLEDARD